MRYWYQAESSSLVPPYELVRTNVAAQETGRLGYLTSGHHESSAAGSSSVLRELKPSTLQREGDYEEAGTDWPGSAWSFVETNLNPVHLEMQSACGSLKFPRRSAEMIAPLGIVLHPLRSAGTILCFLSRKSLECGSC